jgi:1,2-phenylacetyl-CoA epoxidase PaaB subunit
MASQQISEHLAMPDIEDKRDVVASHHEDLEYGQSKEAPKMVNVLHGVPKHALLDSVDVFVREHGLEESVDVFRRGALLAQRPHDYDSIAELTQEDKAAIKYEADHKWKHPFPLYFTGKLIQARFPCSLSVIVCAIGAATQGWDQTGSNGASEFSTRNELTRQTSRSRLNLASLLLMISQEEPTTSGRSALSTRHLISRPR